MIERFGDPALLRELEPRVGVDLTLHEEIALEFEQVTAPLDEVVAWVLEHVQVRPGPPRARPHATLRSSSPPAFTS